MRSTSLRMVSLSLFLVSLLAQDEASARRWRFTGEDHAGDYKLSTELSLPITANGEGFIQNIGGEYQILDYLGATADLGYTFSDTGEFFPGNILLGVKTCYYTKNMKGVNLAIWGSVSAGFGFLEPDSVDKALAVSLARVANKTWHQFFPYSLVIVPRARMQLDLGTIAVVGSVAPIIAEPFGDEDPWYGLDYEGGLAIYLFGDSRGGLSVSAGVNGILDLEKGARGKRENMTSIEMALRLWLEVGKASGTYIGPYIGGSVPLTGEFFGLDGVVMAGFAWWFNAPKAVEEAPAAPQAAPAAPPFSPR